MDCRRELIVNAPNGATIPNWCQICGISAICENPTLEESQAAEIAQLKAELELTEKQRDQAIAFGGVDDCSPDYPDLYEHFKRKAQAHKDFLAGRGEPRGCKSCGGTKGVDCFGKCDSCVRSWGDATYGS